MNTQTWYTKGISINSNDILSSFPLHYLIKPFCKLVFLKIFFFWFSKLRVSSHGQIKFVCQTSLNMYVLALCTTTPFFFSWTVICYVWPHDASFKDSLLTCISSLRADFPWWVELTSVQMQMSMWPVPTKDQDLCSLWFKHEGLF